MAAPKVRAKPSKVARTPPAQEGARIRPPNRRGSPEAIEKRRVARVFNDILGGRGAAAHKLDGRTEKRRLRLLKELEAGKARGSRELKPLDVLQRVQELMDLGEPLSSIRKVTKVRKNALPAEAIVEVVERLRDWFTNSVGKSLARLGGVPGVNIKAIKAVFKNLFHLFRKNSAHSASLKSILILHQFFRILLAYLVGQNVLIST